MENPECMVYIYLYIGVVVMFTAAEIKAEDSEDDAQYYRDEVGEEPDAGMV